MESGTSIRGPTIACHSVSSVPRVASTCEGPECVGAGSLYMTRRLSQTFINICRWKIADCMIRVFLMTLWIWYVGLPSPTTSTYMYLLPRRHQYLLCTALDCCKQETLSKEPLTIACHSISSVPRVASTCEGPECVGAGSACMTRRLSQTFIDVCRRGLHQVTGDTLRH